MSTLHRDRAISRLITQFKDKENITKLLEVLMEELDEIEQAQIDILFQKEIDTAVGFQLDIIGENLGLRRDGLSDSDYRVLLKLQKRINSSRGQAETVILAWKELTGTSAAELEENFPAGIALYSDSGMPSLNTLSVMQKIVAATVKITYRFSTGNAFAFDGPTTANKGWGTVHDNSFGGKFVGSIEVD